MLKMVRASMRSSDVDLARQDYGRLVSMSAVLSGRIADEFSRGAAMKAMPLILILTMIVATPLCHANDFPTADRVEFVLDCMRDHTGGQFELLNKCSCTIDRLAEQYKYDDFVEAQTMAKAVTIAGERGSTLRDNEDAQKAARHYRASVIEAARACFLR